MSFQAHGRYSIKTQGNIIIVDAEGPYNKEILLAFKNEYKQTMVKICDRYEQWSQITFLNHESILPPEAEIEMTKLNSLKHEKGMTHGVIIFVDVDAPHLMNTQYHRIYKSAGIVLAIMNNLDEAKVWLKEEANIEID